MCNLVYVIQIHNQTISELFVSSNLATQVLNFIALVSESIWN